MVKYENSKIYKLYNNISNDVYYGSTCSALSRRLSEHKSHYKSYTEGKGHYVTSFKLFENNAIVGIVLVENVSVTNKDELHKKEREYIESNECLNKNIPSRTSQEYNKTYREYNKIEIANWKKTRIVCDKCGCQTDKVNKASHQKTQKCISASITSETISVTTEADELNYRLSNLTVQ